MELFRNRYLMVPMLLFAVVFGVDKIFGLDAVLEYTLLWKKVEPAFYASRRPLFEQLKDDYPKRTARGERLGLILGTSRTGEFSSDDLAAIFPRSYTYNFSAPLGCPSYHAYWLDKILSAGIKPDFVIIEAEPVLFTPNAAKYSLAYSYDPVFVAKHIDLFRDIPADLWTMERGTFSFDEAETYYLKEAFQLYRHPFSPANIIENEKEVTLPHPTQLFVTMKQREIRRALQADLPLINTRNLGGIPNPIGMTVPADKMEEDAENIMKMHLSGSIVEKNGRKVFLASPTQVSFFKEMVERLAAAKIRTAVYWPLVSEPYRRRQKELGLLSGFQSDLAAFLAGVEKKFPGSRVRMVDPYPDPGVTCRKFVDSHHLSGACFGQIAGAVSRAIENPAK